jgi:NAD(P)-dependent dehydrogenase (short-subunit alcohol dehydrogenase family)
MNFKNQETKMSDILKGKVVIVTGASSGIGRAIAIAAAHCRWRLALSDLKLEL